MKLSLCTLLLALSMAPASRLFARPDLVDGWGHEEVSLIVMDSSFDNVIQAAPVGVEIGLQFDMEFFPDGEPLTCQYLSTKFWDDTEECYFDNVSGKRQKFTPSTAEVYSYHAEGKIRVFKDPPPPAPQEQKDKTTPQAGASAPAGKIVSVAVSSGGTQQSVTGNKNWGVVRDDHDLTIVEATVHPDTPAVRDMIIWTGGTAVAGANQKCEVDRMTSRKANIKATIGQTNADLDLWIVWAEITIRTAGVQSNGNNKQPPANSGGNKLGELNDEQDGIAIAEAIGKIEAVVTLSPTGVNAVIKGGWDIRRWVNAQGYNNGVATVFVDQDDTSLAIRKDLVPDADDKIYDLDGPTCGRAQQPGQFNINHTKESYASFSQWVTWNQTQCSSSDQGKWHYHAAIDDDLDPNNRQPNGAGNADTVLNTLGQGNPALPNRMFQPRP